jgi:hypothetical protein
MSVERMLRDSRYAVIAAETRSTTGSCGDANAPVHRLVVVTPTMSAVWILDGASMDVDAVTTS